MDKSWTLLTSTSPSRQPAEAETKAIEDARCAADETTHRGQEGCRGEMGDRDAEIRRAEATATTVQHNFVPAGKIRVFLSGTLHLVASAPKTTSDGIRDFSDDDTTIARDSTYISHDVSDAIRALTPAEAK
ncbi:hypothetical protein C8R43DRAFT_943524 [Mycena crocata]|nr:hypothetical protein C8R43DRAFT_943524 [Mycena crocata]